MKNLFKAILLGVLVGNTALGAAVQGQNSASNLYGKSFLQVPQNQATDLGANKALIETGNKNLLINASFEHKVFDTSWTLLGSATDAVETSTIVDGAKAAKLTITGSGDGIAASLTPAVNTLNMSMEASCKVNTSMTNIQVCATAGGVEQACQSVPGIGAYQTVTNNFVGPANGTAVGVKVKSTSSGTGTVYVDDCYVGPARNIAQVSQAQLIGGVVITGCSGSWTTSSGSFASFPASTGCVYTTFGSAQAPSTQIPAVTFPSIGPGEYMLNYEGMLQNGGTSGASMAYYQFFDGTNSARETDSFYASANLSSWGTGFTQSISYTTPQSNITFQIRGKTLNSSATIFGTTANPGVIKVYYYPSASQTVVQGDLTTANWAGYTTVSGGNNFNTTSVQPTWADPGTSGTPSVTTKGSPRNITCTQAGTLAGISCNLPRAGNYRVCANVEGGNASSSIPSYYQLYDVTNSVGIDTGVTGSLYQSIKLCGTASMASANSAAIFKIRMSNDSASTAVIRNVNNSINPIEWTVDLMDTPMGQPFVVPSTGTGVVNYMTGGDGEKGANICKPYANAAGVAPVDGNGGSPTVTCALSSTSPISGTQSYSLVKPASNVQGQGWSFPFTVDSAGQAKMLQVSFDYQVDANYTVGSDSTTPDIVAYVYGPTDGTPQLTQLTPYKALGGAGTLKFQGNFQTAASGTAYRLILHEPNTGTLSSSIKVDNISVSPVLRQFGTPVTDWQAYTPTFSASFGTTSNVSAKYRRHGDSMDLDITVGMGTGTAAAGTFTLPAGVSIDTTKLDYTSATTALVGLYGSDSTAPSGGSILSVNTDSTHLYIGGGFSGAGAAGSDRTATMSNFQATSAFVIKVYGVPISGWSSSTQMSDQSGDNRVIATKYSSTNQTIGTGSTATILFSNKNYDLTSSYNPATGVWTAPAQGKYKVSAAVAGTWGAAASNFLVLYLYKNGSLYSILDRRYQNNAGSSTWVSGSDEIDLNATDTLQIQMLNNLSQTWTGDSNATSSYFDISRISGNQQIAASEGVAVSYWASASASVTAGNPINFDSKEYDSHSAVTTGTTTWAFKAPSQGKYRVSAWLNASSANAAFIQIYKNGVANKNICYAANVGSTPMTCAGSVQLNAGDSLDLRPSATTTFTGHASLSNTWGTNIEIEKVAN